ncbi:Competence protein F homolog, phosphoribosyltransferase domain; protein YhgH required for utilization of DNA as sole source of carbon and energy [hydrothermal vent metagenome]|uniref:Competence protein F homolog, phosphoribosyltransferase domain protein YhgH required for utilization of DNA as sole source of carbon and energy n=1 Tax=hydrothermal vent metagenome TaxID=652676 RepID=A0A3B0TEV7_9ZZZZ
MSKGNRISNRTGFLKLPFRIARAVLDHFYPPVCINCEVAVLSPDTLCAGCWRKLRPISAPLCERLGLPFEVFIGPDALSAEAIADPPEFDRARSAFVHNDVARALISRLKFGDRPELAKFCARLMLGAGAQLLEKQTILVPTPLHRSRQFQRRFNQSGELARQMHKQGGFVVDPLLVIRQRPTRPQIGLTARQRAHNVAGAFAVTPDGIERCLGHPLVIIDDVMTTGATVNAITRALRQKGFERIDVISFSRVVIGGTDPI